MPFFSSTKTPKGQKKKHHSHGESMKQLKRRSSARTPPALAPLPHAADRHAEGQVRPSARRSKKKNWITRSTPSRRWWKAPLVDLDSNGRLSAIEICAAVLWYYVKLASQIRA